MRPTSLKSFLSCTMLCLSANLAGCADIPAPEPQLAPDHYYSVPPSAAVGPPGSIVDIQAMEGAPAGARAYRTVYRSRDAQGRPVVVSGMIMVPKMPAPGRPVIAWAHPTTGVVPRCAPSLSPLRYAFIPGLKDMLDRGFIVAATDYQGLGTEGPHPFLVGESEAHSVIDAVRAARSVPGGAGSRFAVWGHSQGGHAALFAGVIARSYAPELELTGIATAAPATDLTTLFREDANTTGGMNITALALWSWSQVYGQPLASVVRPEAMASVETVAGECIGSLRTARTRSKADKQLANGFLKVSDLPSTPPWKAYVEVNSVRPVAANIPLFIAQGTADTLVDPNVTRSYAKALCRNGNRVELDMLPGVRHGFAAFKSSRQAIAWLADRFAGTPAPDECLELQSGPAS
jgi:acetyl esterase/lipase